MKSCGVSIVNGENAIVIVISLIFQDKQFSKQKILTKRKNLNTLKFLKILIVEKSSFVNSYLKNS